MAASPGGDDKKLVRLLQVAVNKGSLSVRRPKRNEKRSLLKVATSAKFSDFCFKWKIVMFSSSSRHKWRSVYNTCTYLAKENDFLQAGKNKQD
jgi:hypothetical protein